MSRLTVAETLAANHPDKPSNRSCLLPPSANLSRHVGSGRYHLANRIFHDLELLRIASLQGVYSEMAWWVCYTMRKQHLVRNTQRHSDRTVETFRMQRWVQSNDWYRRAAITFCWIRGNSAPATGSSPFVFNIFCAIQADCPSSV